MPSLISFGRILLILGISLTVVGGMVYLFGKLGVNRIPGTLVLNQPGGQCIIPIVASIVLSVLLTLILNLIIRFMNR